MLEKAAVGGSNAKREFEKGKAACLERGKVGGTLLSIRLSVGLQLPPSTMVSGNLSMRTSWVGRRRGEVLTVPPGGGRRLCWLIGQLPSHKEEKGLHLRELAPTAVATGLSLTRALLIGKGGGPI